MSGQRSAPVSLDSTTTDGLPPKPFSGEPRKTPKKKQRRERERGRGQEEVIDVDAETEAGPSTIAHEKEVGKETVTFELGDEFIPLALDSDTEREGKGKDRERERRRTRGSSREREWDKGKGRAQDWERERDSSARKRKADEYDRGDAYVNRKQRTETASRKAPWLVDLDWEGCTNVAEL